MDILGISKMSSSGNKYVLVIIDKLTRFGILEVVPNQEVETVLEKFVHNMLQMGFPRHIFTNQRAQFRSKLAIGLAKRSVSLESILPSSIPAVTGRLRT